VSKTRLQFTCPVASIKSIFTEVVSKSEAIPVFRKCAMKFYGEFEVQFGTR
jgi:hypothetical protein